MADFQAYSQHIVSSSEHPNLLGTQMDWTRSTRFVGYPASGPLLSTRVFHRTNVVQIAGPRVLHGCFAALTDIFLCRLTSKVLGDRYVSSALFVSLTSFFHVLALSRSFSNSLETSLATIAFSYYPWLPADHIAFDRTALLRLFLFAALACAVRPTNAIIWVYLIGTLLWRVRHSTRSVVTVVSTGLVVGIATLLGIFILDSWFYGEPTFTPFNFLATNLSNVSLFYGGSPWHYYLSQAVPILCTTSLVFVLREIRCTVQSSAPSPLKTALGCVVWTISVYSLAGHKEWRFIHPILPLLHVFAAKSLYDMTAVHAAKGFNSLSKRFFFSPGFLLWLNVPVSCFVALSYCSAPIQVMAFLRSLPDIESGGVGFLMPCHSTPGHAFLHRPGLANGKMWALGCEPPLQHQDLTTYRDQTTVFFSSPTTYLRERFPGSVDPSFPVSPFPVSIPGRPDIVEYAWLHEWPQYLVFFGALLEQSAARELLSQRGYEEIWTAGRSWEGDSDTRKGGVRVWKYNIIST
ncbi:unnamed protein product [Mycena citricolor]|uniref:Mannosyltransferase n=1 Tax=Mycena citricolor TaxID=2018698 RepID=A0AAD2HKM7_9AGAR|nr:unnamed protein product [Mycena citricolor]